MVNCWYFPGTRAAGWALFTGGTGGSTAFIFTSTF
jgi:hypothetical protein